MRSVMAAVCGVGAVLCAPSAAASAPSLCDRIGGQWNGQYCHASVRSERNAIREIDIAIPAEIDNPAFAAVLTDYLSTLMSNWRSVGAHMVTDSWGHANVEAFQHGNLRTLVFHEDYHADGPFFNNAYRTFTVDQASGRQVHLADLMDPAAIPGLAGSYIQAALDQAPPPHDPGTYPFVAERWTPDKAYSGGYQAWALTPDELVLYMPDYPVARDTPIDFTPAKPLWSMDGGTVQAHIPLAVLSPILRAAAYG